MGSLAKKRILLGVTGGIAAYKSADLVRRLKERGAEVQVVMTKGAQAFVTPLTFQAISGRAVRSELLDPAAEAGMGHIELARWADLILIAPASANFIARFARGMADDLLATLCLATDAPIALAPAMNRLMWANPATQENTELLSKRGVRLWGPGEGSQACGEMGEGRMLEPLELAQRAADFFGEGLLKGTKVLITAGPTREALDPVRYITNRSSGRMGFAVAEACAAAGAEVTLISGPVTLPTPAGVSRVDTESAEQMHAAVMARAAQSEVLIACAAVADYRPHSTNGQKLKKQNEAMPLQLVRNPDILADAAQRYPQLFTVGFAAETDHLETYARGKLDRKKLDMIAANWVGADRAFDREDNALSVFWPGGGQELPAAPKKVLARQLVELIAQRYQSKNRAVA
ncbi:MAG: bifunctional phosphopantothenoylcysteine decarboxylase/phosphopantothenate--cysteine ligase CoaBC [Nevskiales bacterium]